MLETLFLVGDILVEGVMEGKYTGQRSVNSDADIYALSTYEKERKEAFIQQEEVRTGEFKKNVEIYLHNFKINFKKGVPNFENCDTIKVYKKLKLFSNYYIPIEIVNVTHYELEKNFKTYTEEELTAKITNLLQKEFEEEVEYSIVGSAEADPMNGKISNESPVGLGLLGHKSGEIVIIETPSGELKFRIDEIKK